MMKLNRDIQQKAYTLTGMTIPLFQPTDTMKERTSWLIHRDFRNHHLWLPGVGAQLVRGFLIILVISYPIVILIGYQTLQAY